MSRLRRVLIVTAGLAATGAIVGAVIAPLLLLALGLARGMTVRIGELSFLLYPAAFGAAAGAVLAPTAAWSLMRHVPIWRAIVETLIGTLAGAFVGMFFAPVYRIGFLWPILLGVLGFVAAAMRLRLSRKQVPVSVTG